MQKQGVTAKKEVGKPRASKQARISAYIRALEEWSPISDLIDDGLPESELSIIGQTVAETLQQEEIVLRGSTRYQEIEDFLDDVLREYGIMLEDALLEDMTQLLINTHNKQRNSS